jgi:hypothetical protein
MIMEPYSKKAFGNAGRNFLQEKKNVDRKPLTELLQALESRYLLLFQKIPVEPEPDVSYHDS